MSGTRTVANRSESEDTAATHDTSMLLHTREWESQFIDFSLTPCHLYNFRSHIIWCTAQHQKGLLPEKRRPEYAQAPTVTCTNYTYRQRWAQPHRRPAAICWFGPTLRPKVHDAWSMQHPGRIQEILTQFRRVQTWAHATQRSSWLDATYSIYAWYPTTFLSPINAANKFVCS